MSNQEELGPVPTELANDDWRLLFHGTAKSFNNFSEERIGTGPDENSALGVFLSESPASCSEYAQVGYERGEGNEAVVLAVLCPALSPSMALDDYYHFFGVDEETGQQVRSHADFARLRQSHIADGFDIVDYEDGEQQISVALRPQVLRIVARLTLAQAQMLDELLQECDEPLSGANRWSLLQEALSLNSVLCDRPLQSVARLTAK